MSELIDIDVGGDAESSVHPLVNKPSLANIPFRWMVRQCLGSKAEISFNSSALKDIGIQPVPANNAEVQDETFINHDEGDAVCKLHSPFKSINAWWVLELIPMRRNFPPIEDGKVIEGKPWKRKIQSVFLWSLGAVLLRSILNTFDRNNRFRGRDIWPKEEGINFHSSVKIRMDDPKAKYKPRARWSGQVNWVD